MLGVPRHFLYRITTSISVSTLYNIVGMCTRDGMRCLGAVAGHRLPPAPHVTFHIGIRLFCLVTFLQRVTQCCGASGASSGPARGPCVEDIDEDSDDDDDGGAMVE